MNVTLRIARESDLAKIVDFYRQANDKNILPRTAKELKYAIRYGVVILVTADDAILAASAAFVVSKPRQPALFEFGGTLVTLPVRGFDLQKIFVAARICFLVIFHQSRLPGSVYTFIKQGNSKSSRNLQDSGFVRATTVPSAYLEPCQTCTDRNNCSSGQLCCYDFYSIDQASVKTNVRYFLAASADRANSRGEPLKINSQLFMDARERAVLKQFSI